VADAKATDASPVAADVGSDRFGRTWVLGIAIAVGIIYVATAARDIVVGDTGDFLTAAATLGVAHPPGYPLLVLLGHLFSWLPVGPLPFRINLIAVASGAATVALVFSTARRLGTGRWAALIAALTLAFNPLFWEWSLAIEAFALNNFLAALLIYFLVRWEREPERTVFLPAAAACAGLGAANHLTVVFLVPFVVVVMWRLRAHITARVLVACVASVAIGLLPYLFIPWAAARNPFLNWGSVSSAAGLLRHFLRSDYGTGSLVAAGSSPGSPLERLAGFSASFTIIEAGLLLAGVVEAYRRARWYLLGCVLSVAVAGPAFVAYANMDVSNAPLLWALRRFFLLPHVILAPLAAFGVLALARMISPRIPVTRWPHVERTLVVVALAIVLATAARHYSTIDQSKNRLAHTFAQDILKTLEPNAVLLALGDEVAFPVAYVQAVEKERPDVTLVMLGLFRSYAWYLSQLRRRDPALVIPFDHYDPSNPAATLRALVDANPQRSFATVGALTDNSLSNAYWLYRRGLVEQIEPMSTDVGLDAAAQENERLANLYRLPDPSKIRRKTFEISILAKYARGPVSMAKQFELAHLDRQAEVWYRRALAINPEDADVRQALEQLRPSR